MLQPLNHPRSAVTAEEFRQYLLASLGGQFDRAALVHEAYGEYFSFKVTNVLYLAAQDDSVEDVLRALEQGAVVMIPTEPLPEDLMIQRMVDIRQYFELIYENFFPIEKLHGPPASRIIVPGRPQTRTNGAGLILPAGARL